MLCLPPPPCLSLYTGEAKGGLVWNFHFFSLWDHMFRWITGLFWQSRMFSLHFLFPKTDRDLLGTARAMWHRSVHSRHSILGSRTTTQHNSSKQQIPHILVWLLPPGVVWQVILPLEIEWSEEWAWDTAGSLDSIPGINLWKLGDKNLPFQSDC